MNPLFLVPLAGFLGSFHCAGMCGPFVGWYSLGRTEKVWPAHVAYHGGRLTAYLSVGIVAGFLGQGFFYLGSVLNLQKIMMLAMGAGLVLAGLAHYLPDRLMNRGPVGGLRRLPYRLLGKLGKSHDTTAAAGLLGLLSALLPCGFLYSFALVAMAAGHPLAALWVMVSFWFGTLPALLGVGLLSTHLSRPLLLRLRQLVPALLILAGILAIAGKWMTLPEVGALGGGPLCR